MWLLEASLLATLRQTAAKYGELLQSVHSEAFFVKLGNKQDGPVMEAALAEAQREFWARFPNLRGAWAKIDIAGGNKPLCKLGI